MTFLGLPLKQPIFFVEFCLQNAELHFIVAEVLFLLRILMLPLLVALPQQSYFGAVVFSDEGQVLIGLMALNLDLRLEGLNNLLFNNFQLHLVVVLQLIAAAFALPKLGIVLSRHFSLVL